MSPHKVAFLLYFSHRIQHRGISCSLALCRRLKMSLFTCSSSLSDYRVETGQNIYGQSSSTQVYQHKQAKPPITLKQIKRNRKKRKKTVQNNALTTISLVALCKHTTFIVSKQSGCVFTLTGGKAPTTSASPSRNTALKYHTDITGIVKRHRIDSLDRKAGGSFYQEQTF